MSEPQMIRQVKHDVEWAATRTRGRPTHAETGPGTWARLAHDVMETGYVRPSHLVNDPHPDARAALDVGGTLIFFDVFKREGELTIAFGAGVQVTYDGYPSLEV
jgi:hypothetical protein